MNPRQRRVADACIACIVFPVSVLLSSPACAFEYGPGQTLEISGQIIRSMRGKTICPPSAAIVPGDIVTAMQRSGELHPERRDALTNEDLYRAFVMQWPCPFDPTAVAAPATAGQLSGVWRLAADSRSQNPAVMKPDPYPVDCAAMAFGEGGRLNTMVAHNMQPCPTFHAADFSGAALLPKTIAWTLDALNELTITRPDDPRFREVWRVWSVERPFDHGSAHYEAGDLLMYLKRYNDAEDHDITLYYRHLQRITD